MSVLSTLIEKEITQFRRNPFLSKMVIAYPIIIMLVIPWVTTMDVRHISVSVVDMDGSSLSRLVVSKIANSDYFSLEGVSKDYRKDILALEDGKVDAILSIPDGFESTLLEGNGKKVSISANAVNAIKGSFGAQYLAGVVATAQKEFMVSKGMEVPKERFIVRNMYNPTMEYRNFMIPAMLVILLLLICGFLPALNIVMEKENGTIEQINVTPVSQFAFTLAKLIPYWLIGFFVITIAMLVAWLVYGLSPSGPLGAIFLASFLFILSMSAFGVIAANLADSMIQSIFIMAFFVMIFMLMSGMLTPLTSMPGWAQAMSCIFPPRYFTEILRAVYLKGATVGDKPLHYVALAGLSVLFTLAASLTYRKRA